MENMRLNYLYFEHESSSFISQRHLEISREIGDDNGVEIATQSLEDLMRRRRERSSTSSSSTLESASGGQEASAAGKESKATVAADFPTKPKPKRWAA